MTTHPRRKQRIQGQPSWRIFSDKVATAVTEQGGHLAPVDFRLDRRTVSPFSIAPWAEEKLPSNTPSVLRSLRGDFFCAPFGGNETPYRGEKHLPHGDPANALWKFDSCDKNSTVQTLHLSLQTTSRKGRIDKFIGLRDGETNLYCRHVISQMEGPMSFGHHAMLKFPKAEGSGTISTSRILYGQVAPIPIESPANGGYQCLKAGSMITRLDRVETADGKRVDLRKYPARQGFEDLVMLVHESEPDFAWTACTFPRQRYVWFSLKDPAILRSTILWISNGGRHYPPWNGRHLGVMGIEDVTSYFHYGLAESSRPNPVNRAGFPTCVKLRKKDPLTVSYIMGVAAIPAGFGKDEIHQTRVRRHRPFFTRGPQNQNSSQHHVPTKPMKRSEINQLVVSASRCFEQHGWTLPPRPRWDVTDFGLGDWTKNCLVLVNLAEHAEYCEKLMYARKGMVTPVHCHHKKKEDIISRWGTFRVKLWLGHPDEKISRAFSVLINNEKQSVPAGAEIDLKAGERITLIPNVYHTFYPLTEECIIGEVSTANDDANDNFFVDPNIGRFPHVEEDEAPIVKLLSDPA